MNQPVDLNRKNRGFDQLARLRHNRRICSRSDREKTIYHFEHHNAHFDHFGDDTVEEPWVGDLRSGTIFEDEFRATAYYWISVMHGKNGASISSEFSHVS